MEAIVTYNTKAEDREMREEKEMLAGLLQTEEVE
jgi:hypothetical protein